MDELKKQTRSLIWRPSPEVPTHAGQPVAPEMEFFARPPLEIGELLSAYSTLRLGKKPMGVVTRLIVVLTPAVALWLLLSVLFFKPSHDIVLSNVVGGVTGLLAIFPMCYFTRFKHECSFIGKKGMARYIISRSRDAVPTKELLEFRNATDLFTGQSVLHAKGIYAGTQYFFRWTDDSGRPLLALKGTHNGKKGPPPPTDAYHFGSAGEVAWSEYRLPALNTELERNGWITFRIQAHDTIRVGRGFVEFNLGGKQSRVDRRDLEHFSCNGELFYFKTSEANWHSSEGKFKFSYSSIGNAQLFLLMLHSLMGVSFE